MTASSHKLTLQPWVHQPWLQRQPLMQYTYWATIRVRFFCLFFGTCQNHKKDYNILKRLLTLKNTTHQHYDFVPFFDLSPSTYYQSTQSASNQRRQPFQAHHRLVPIRATVKTFALQSSLLHFQQFTPSPHELINTDSTTSTNHQYKNYLSVRP